jgi:MarR family transcriptional regulator for hemolysin
VFANIGAGSAMIGKDDNSLGALLHDVAHLLRVTIDRELTPYNLTRAKWLALGVLDRKEGLTQTELAAELELGDATVGRLVERLEERGFIERRPDKSDARVKRLYIQQVARPELDELEHVAASVRQKALRGLTKSNQSLLLQALSKMKSNLGAGLQVFFVFWLSRTIPDLSVVMLA